MFLELHILQNFAPSNLNRDDTNSPKSCEFGGYPRARISSQCLKRAIRTYFKDGSLLPPSDLAVRTKRLLEELTRRLEGAGRDPEQARSVVITALAGVGFKVVEEDKTQYLLFLGEREIARIADACLQNWDSLAAIAPVEPGGTAKQAKKTAKDQVPAEVAKTLNRGLDGGKAADLALFGRMLADRPELNVDAACQVAHALSTNRVATDFDFYTAVDDLKPEDTAGADMLGTVEFNSACFYRYSNLDLDQLRQNLSGDRELASSAVAAFVEAAVRAVPTGKQNSMAAHNPPSLILATLSHAHPQNLANAFVDPVRPTDQGDLVHNSIRTLDQYWERLAKMYGAADLEGAWVCTSHDHVLGTLAPHNVESFGDLLKGVTQAVSSHLAGGAHA